MSVIAGVETVHVTDRFPDPACSPDGRALTPLPLGPDVERIGLGPDLILGAVEAALEAQGERRVVLEPREHLVPDPAFDGHFNLLRAYVAPLDVAGVKVVGDYHGNYKLGLPSELALLTLYDPRTGVPRAIVDATAITEWRTGAVTALGGRHLARAGREGARPRRRPRDRVRQRRRCSTACYDFDEIRVTSARPESRDGVRGAAGGGARQAGARRATRSRRRSAAPTSSSRRRGSPRRSRSCATEWIAPRHARHALRHDERRRSSPSIDVMDKVYVDDWGQCKGGRFGALRAHVEAGPASRGVDRGRAGRRRRGHAARPRVRRRADPLLAPRAGDDRHRARPGDPRPRARAGRRHAPALPMIVLERRGPARPGYRRIVLGHEPVAIDPGALERVDGRARAAARPPRPGRAAYGVNTGLGLPRARRALDAGASASLPARDPAAAARARARRSRAEVVRGALLLRLAGFLAGAAGVSPGAVRVPRRAAQRRLDAASSRRAGITQRGRGRRAEPPVRRRSPATGEVLRGRRAGARGRGARAPRRRAVRARRQGGHRARQRRAARARAGGSPRPRAPGRCSTTRRSPARSPPRSAGRRAALLAPHRRAQGRPGAGSGSHARAGRAARGRGADWADRPAAAGLVPRPAAGPRRGARPARRRRTPRSRASCARSPTARCSWRRTATSRRASTRAATSTPRRSASRSTRWRSASPRWPTSSEKRLHRLLDSRYSRPARPARRRAGAPDGPRVPAQGGDRATRPRTGMLAAPASGAPGRRLDGPGGLPGVHVRRRRAARADPRQPGADRRERAARGAPGARTCAAPRCRRGWRPSSSA